MSIKTDLLQIYIRIFKHDKLVELWGKNKSDKKFQIINTFNVCSISGNLGPKRQQGDLQVPEGYYHINHFNPFSNFYLSLGINYPNNSDRILGVKGKLGGDIYIHGDCVTIGYVPLTNNYIKELYVYSVEAKNNGQKNIPVTIFPTKLTDDNFKYLKSIFNNNQDNINLWSDLKKGFDYFNSSKKLPSISFLPNGRHQVH